MFFQGEETTTLDVGVELIDIKIQAMLESTPLPYLNYSNAGFPSPPRIQTTPYGYISCRLSRAA